LDEDVQVELRRVLAWVFDAEIITVPGIPLPSSAYDRSRGQYLSTPILRQLARVKPRQAEGLLGLADVDLYVPELNFVFDVERLRPEQESAMIAAPKYAKTDECRSVFLRRCFGEGNPPPCGMCDRCRARVAMPVRTRVSCGLPRKDRRRTHAHRARSARTTSSSEARRNTR
jgi:hypothetical protein